MTTSEPDPRTDRRSNRYAALPPDYWDEEVPDEIEMQTLHIADPCPECGEVGACAVDAEGRAPEQVRATAAIHLNSFSDSDYGRSARKLTEACRDLPAPKPPWKSPPDDRPDLTEQQCRYAYDAGIDPDRHDPWAQIGRALIAAGWDPEGGSVSDYWDDDDETWHCGTCGNAPCECGDDIVMVVKVPGIRAADADADLVAMALMAMCNEQRADNGGADRPIRLLTASFVEEADRG